MEYYIAHYGIPDQKWGNRRYQNKDGSLTPLGRIRYGIGQKREKLRNKKYDDGSANSFGKLDERKKSNTKENRPGESKTFIDNLSTKSEAARNVAFMTDDEITEAIKRMNLEKTYRDMADQKIEDSKTPARKAVDRFVNKFVDTAVDKLAVTTAGKLVGSLFSNKKEENNKNSEDYSKIDAKNLSSKELKEANQRLQSEKEYKEKLKSLGYKDEGNSDQNTSKKDKNKNKQTEQTKEQIEKKKESASKTSEKEETKPSSTVTLNQPSYTKASSTKQEVKETTSKKETESDSRKQWDADFGKIISSFAESSRPSSPAPTYEQQQAQIKKDFEAKVDAYYKTSSDRRYDEDFGDLIKKISNKNI